MGNCCIRDVKEVASGAHNVTADPNSTLLPSPVKEDLQHSKSLSKPIVSPRRQKRRQTAPASKPGNRRSTWVIPQVNVEITAIPLLAKELQRPFSEMYDMEEPRQPLKSLALGTHKVSKLVTWVRKVDRLFGGGRGIRADERVKQELEVVTTLSHPCLLQPCSLLYTRREMYVLSENFTGTRVVDYMQIAASLSETKVKLIAYQLLRLMVYVHTQEITLKTLSLSTLLFYQSTSEEIQVKYLGVGGWETPDVSENSSAMLNPALYEAPEGDSSGAKGDIWSCGMILLVLLTNSVPVRGKTREGIKAEVKAGIGFNEKIWRKFDRGAEQLISLMLSANPTSRPAAAECLSHPWLQACISSVPASLPTLMTNLRRFQRVNSLQLCIFSFLVTHAFAPTDKQSAHDVFAYINRSANGRISLPELKEAFAQVHRAEFSQSLASDVFRAVDINHNGTIDYTEFLLTSSEHSTLTNSAFLRTVFNIIDPESTGSVTVQELSSALKIKDGSLMQEMIRNRGENINYEGFKKIVKTAAGEKRKK